MIGNIKVTATYEVDNSFSKFDALLEQYNAAKAIADKTKSAKQPLINAMGKKKLELIKIQLLNIVDQVWQLAKIVDGLCTVKACVNYCNKEREICYSDFANRANYYQVEISVGRDGSYRIKLNGRNIDNEKPDNWFKEDGIVTLWNELELYPLLQKECEDKIKYQIDLMNKRTREINSTYENMINC